MCEAKVESSLRTGQRLTAVGLSTQLPRWRLHANEKQSCSMASLALREGFAGGAKLLLRVVRSEKDLIQEGV